MGHVVGWAEFLWAAVPSHGATPASRLPRVPGTASSSQATPREQVPRVALASGRPPVFVPRPIPPASSLPRSDGGRRWQAASPTCQTGRARVGAAAGTRCLPQPAGALPGIVPQQRAGGAEPLATSAILQGQRSSVPSTEGRAAGW